MKIVFHRPIIMPEYLLDTLRSDYLGFNYLTSYLAQEFSDIKIFVAYTFDANTELKPDMVCISSVSVMWNHAKAVAVKLREDNFSGPVIFTRPPVTIPPQTLVGKSTEHPGYSAQTGGNSTYPNSILQPYSRDCDLEGLGRRKTGLDRHRLLGHVPQLLKSIYRFCRRFYFNYDNVPLPKFKKNIEAIKRRVFFQPASFKGRIHTLSIRLFRRKTVTGLRFRLGKSSKGVTS